MRATAEARALLADADSLEGLWHATTAVNNELAVAGVFADAIEAGIEPGALDGALDSAAVAAVQGVPAGQRELDPHGLGGGRGVAGARRVRLGVAG